MKKNAISFQQVVKNFSLNSQKTFKEFIPAIFSGEQTKHQFTALNNISFDIKSGETVGIIGPNGSGKSTILKLIAGVMGPTSGHVLVNGRVSPLIELGAGFHFELTGRENIFLNGAILGLSRQQIENNLDSIINFANISEFIDQPAKRYSSGMYMRLAFSIAVHVNPEILLIDEILAVGDPEFQQKCFAKMKEFKKNGVTIIFVSHDLEAVEKFCQRVILLDHSNIVANGDPKNVCQLLRQSATN
jgi:ABC-type polysaccharide/polyol phosphate transport system ATPase subunit